MLRKITFLLILACTTFAFNVSAQTTRQRPLHRENTVIRHNAKSGQLTRNETKRLKKEESRLRKQAIRAKTNDGSISAAEKRRLKAERKRLDRDIRRQSHDSQHA